jgi:hypothetical protein
MIAIAVAAALIAYAWTMGYLNFTTTKVGKSIQIQSMAKDDAGNLLAYVQNVGQGEVEFDPDNCAYINDLRGTILGITPNTPLGEGQTATITLDLTGISITDELIKVKVFTKDGTFSEIKSKEPVSSLPTAYTLTITVTPLAGGIVEQDPAPPYDFGDVVVLTETPNAGYTFAYWSGDGIGDDATRTVTMDGNKYVTAYFTEDEYTVTLDVVGSGDADMTPVQTTYTYGDVVTLEATESVPSWTFQGWSSSTPNIEIADTGQLSTTATIKGSGIITATFALNQHQITVTASPGGAIGGTFRVTYTKGGITYTNEQHATTWTELVDATTSVTISQPQSSITDGGTQYVFDNYNPSATVTMNAPRTITLEYNTQYYLTVSSTYDSPTGQGWYDSDATAYAGLDISEIDHANSTKHVFTSWGTDASGTDYAQSNAITMNAPKTATANWKTQYWVQFAVTGSGTTNATSWYDQGANSIYASPAGGYSFSSWTATGSITITPTDQPSATATINGPSTITANFASVTPRNLIRNPGFEVNNSTWIESVNNLQSDRADHYYDRDERSGSHCGRTDSRSPNSNGNAYAMLTQNLDSTPISSMPDQSDSLTVYLHRRNTASSGTRPVEVRIYAGTYMLSYIWCSESQLPSNSSTQKYVRIGEVTSISDTSYTSLVRNLRSDWISSGLSASAEISRIELVSYGERWQQSGTRYAGQDIVWDDLQLLYLP